MNPLRPPSSSSRNAKAGRGMGAPAALNSPSAAAAPSARAAPSSPAPGAPAVGSSPTLESLRAAGFPQWWSSSSLRSSEGIYPQGGFTNILNSNITPENFHLVGNTRTSTTTSPNAASLKPIEKETIVVDADETNEDERTDRRLNYTKDEDVRLADAWLKHSKDPVAGTDRSGDQYWANVTEEYNKGTEVNRRRNRNQLKIRWDRLKKPTMEFHGCWTATTKVYRSGYSDDQLMEMAEKMYAKDHNDKDFQFKHFWKVVRNERKWSAYVKKEMDKEKKGASNLPAVRVNLEDDPDMRTMGHKKARNELHGKKKIPQSYSAISDKVDKFIEVSSVARKDRDKMAETQQILAHSKVEAARLKDKAAEKLGSRKASKVQDVERLMAIGERRGFPGMLGSIDCMHWHWEKCPYGWKGMYTRGDHGVPTIILEAVASHDRWIWHAFFGVAGSNNDINVLSQSDLFVKHLRGEDPKLQYTVNGREYNLGYYLGDGIYPEWPVFVKSIKRPQVDKDKLFAQKQEEARKDVECAFGILQSRWCILRRPARLFEQGDLQNIMIACIILHNMIIEDEKDIEQVPFDLNEEGNTSIVEEATITHGENPELEEVLDRNTALHDRQAHKQLQSDLIEHIWQKFGNSYMANRN